jgi:flagellar biosynthesis protein FliQ
MEEIKVTWLHAVKIWWSLAWRVLVFGGLAGFLLGLLVGIVGAVTGIENDTIQAWGQIGGMLVSIPVGIWAVKVILTREFPKFRVVLVPSLESRMESRLHNRTPDSQASRDIK